MTDKILPQLVTTFGLLSLLSIGGANAILPETHRQVVEQLHWMSDPTFANLVAIAQTAPGPNVLIISMIGWQVAGFLGLVLATLAIIVPSSVLTFVIGRIMTRFGSSRWLVVTRKALAPVAVGLIGASGLVMTQAAYRGPLTIVITLGMTALVTFTRLSPLWGIAGGAALGISAHHLNIWP